MVEILLVAPNAGLLADALSGYPDTSVRAAAAHDLAAARAHVAGSCFDALLVSTEHGGWAEDLERLLNGLGAATRVIRFAPTEPEVFSRSFASLLPDELGAALPEWPVSVVENVSSSSATAADELLRSLRNDMSQVVHALNNPLAVISGNSQLGLEIARSIAADDSIVEAFSEINHAVELLRGLFSEVTRLRERIDEAIGT